ncbi:MAG: M20/M25/M40 family metallo-hydrolase, partial [Verrucomicrobia bacterium]|nr:M20/M25/M40 family metallo-hydrolase [Verrucomicrobiota bacterium]
LTVNYLIEQFKRLGLKPGNPDGTFIQNVPLVGHTTRPTASYRVGNQRTELPFPSDCVVWSKRFMPEVNVTDSEMIFVGYGVVAPEYDWDDFKGADVRGKTIVMLVNDPPVPDPRDPSKLDEKIFGGKAMTYYGRWTYKYEIAAAKGAAAALIVHETGPAGYPWFVVVGSNSRENFGLAAPDKNMGRAAVEGWVTLDVAKKLFSAVGKDFDQMKKAAVQRDFKPGPLGANASFTIKNFLREVASRNVIAKLEGSDPKLKDEYLIYTAHWDHLGRDPKLEGDQIYNGAYDNASGTAALLELAEAWTKQKPPPKRSILFLAATAEEKGLLGAKYYAEHSLYPLNRTLANLNMDGVNPWGRTRDLDIIGIGKSTLEDLLTEAAKRQGRITKPESEPEKGYYYRSDHFEFAKAGVPAMHFSAGLDYIGKSPGWGRQKREEYTAKDYHKVSDEIKPDWDLSGAVEDVQLLFIIGESVVNGSHWPEWRSGAEFKARREEMLKPALPRGEDITSAFRKLFIVRREGGGYLAR